MRPQPPNQAPQRTRPSRYGCHSHVSRTRSLRYASLWKPPRLEKGWLSYFNQSLGEETICRQLLAEPDRQGVLALADHLAGEDWWDKHRLGYGVVTTLASLQHWASRLKMVATSRMPPFSK